jgi:hypothetical protein
MSRLRPILTQSSGEAELPAQNSRGAGIAQSYGGLCETLGGEFSGFRILRRRERIPIPVQTRIRGQSEGVLQGRIVR